ncbi:MAG: hypothetical protein JNN11_01340 [Candidatus Doudnabacteria bacterium]|nr:hypothetical protein [Candidatus Doudnabacteria bacterium]
MVQQTNKKPFPQYIDTHPRKHLHWTLFLVVALAIAAFVLIYIEQYKTQVEIDALAPLGSSYSIKN